MLAYIARRLLVMVPTLVAISAIVFFIIQLPPGDYLSTMIDELIAQGQKPDSEQILRLREEFGLDRSPIEQYFHWVGGMLVGDLGYSFEYNLPVADVVGERLVMSFVLAFTATLFTYIVAFPIGIYSAVRQYSVGDYALTFLGFIGLATPSFLIALVVLHFSNTWFGTPVGGLYDPAYADQPMSWAKLVSVLGHLWIPMVVIGLSSTAEMIRQLRANLLDELQRPYVVTGRSKGMTERQLLLKYPLRMALNPFIADIGSILPKLISGSAIVGVVLSLPTNGPMLLRALQSQDMYLAGSFLMIEAVLVVFGILLSDVALALLDPRIRLGAGSDK
ncbi:MAG: ABC transporter permease [Alphaproteobacteria bacterium]|nr:ABC transporter permease [Alphaproteobacteria bacterium]